MSKIPVFIWKLDFGQVGCGTYNMKACFVKKGVHVPFAIYSHSENEYNNGIGKAVPCDGSCKNRPGHMEDWGKKRHDSDYAVKGILEKAVKFKARKKPK